MASPSLPGVPRVVPPAHRYYGTLRPPDSLFAALRFLRLAIPWRRLQFVPVRPQTHSRRIIPEFAVPVAPDPAFTRELSGSPKFPENPLDHSPCSSDPGCLRFAGTVTSHHARLASGC